MAAPVEAIHNELCVAKESWLPVQAILVKLAIIVSFGATVNHDLNI